MKNECPIVRDLLPNYIDELTSSETNEFIMSHLQICTDCNQIYQEYSSTLDPVDSNFNENKQQYEENLIKRLKTRNYKIISLSLLIGVSAGMVPLSIRGIDGYSLVFFLYPFLAIFIGLISSWISNDVWIAPCIIFIITSVSSFFVQINGFWFWVLVYTIFSLGGALLGLLLKKCSNFFRKGRSS